LLFRFPTNQAEAPAKRLKVGAQKWVIHRVKKIGTLEWSRSSGSVKKAG